jgi:hypothetical protein
MSIEFDRRRFIEIPSVAAARAIATAAGNHASAAAKLTPASAESSVPCRSRESETKGTPVAPIANSAIQEDML